MSTPLPVTSLAARRFARRAAGLDVLLPGVGSVLERHGYIQIDPINVCGRMHDLILRNRVRDYQVGGLMRHIHGEKTLLPAEGRVAFEHHLPDSAVLAAFPLDAWPHLTSAMHLRTQRDSAWSGRLTPEELDLSNHILAELAIRGPLSSAHIDDNRSSAPGVWGAATLAKSTLQKLFFHGRVLIARRDGNCRLTIFPSASCPPPHLLQRNPPLLRLSAGSL
jgi:uncharacterized protein